MGKEVDTLLKKVTKGISILIDGQIFLTGEEVKELCSIYNQIDSDGEKVFKLLQKAALRYFEAGRIFHEAEGRFYGRLTAKKISEATGLSAQRVSTAIKVHYVFKDKPKELEALTMQEINALIADKPPKGKDGYNRIEFGGVSGGQSVPDWALKAFDKPTVSGKGLKNYRVETPDDCHFWVLKRYPDGDIGSTKYAEVFDNVPQVPDLRIAYKEMIRKMREATEEYYLVKEYFEEDE
jgi:hypothetical protein